MRKMRWWFWSCVLVGSLASLGLLWLTNVPLGVPGEWTWGRHFAHQQLSPQEIDSRAQQIRISELTPQDKLEQLAELEALRRNEQTSQDLLANLMLGFIAGITYFAFVWFGHSRIALAECRRIELVGWQIGLAIFAGIWIFTAAGSGTSGATVGRWPYVLYYPGPSGYFERARYESPDAKEFLRGYEALMQEGDVLHTGTHPPGLFLFFHGLIGIAERNPGWLPAVNAAQPETVREVFDLIDANIRDAIARGDVRKPPLAASDRAVIWLAGLICLSLAAATVWPLYGFLRLDLDRPTSWLLASAWPLIPAIGVFLPKSDVAFAFFAMLTACLWRHAWRRSDVVLAMLAAGVWTVGILCSLAFLPVALWLALVSLFDSWPAIRSGQARQELLRSVRTILPAGVVFFAIMALISWQGEIAIWNVYGWNYHNHAGFYRQHPRTYLAWLAVNPLELMFAAGAPLSIAACFGIGSELRRWRTGAASPLLSPCLATLIVWGWLWLSGKNSGEAARLWTFLLPFVVICAAAWWSSMKDARRERAYYGWLILQAVVCLLTVQRVNGFPM